MSKEKYTKLTLEGLLAKREQMLEAKKTPKKATLYIKSHDATITVQEPSKQVVRDAFEMEGDVSNAYVTRECCIDPPLKSNELMEAFGIADPLDVPDAIFTHAEVGLIAEACLKLAGYDPSSVQVVDDIKN